MIHQPTSPDEQHPSEAPGLPTTEEIEAIIEEARCRAKQRRRRNAWAAAVLTAFGVALIYGSSGGAAQRATPEAGAARPPRVATPPRVSTGRILIGVDRSTRGTFLFRQLATIDRSGMHRIAAAPDPSLGQLAWGGGHAIVFSSEREGGRHVYRMALGGPAQRITPLGSAQESPSVSPDGKLVVYSEYESETYRDLGLHVANVDGANPRRLTPAGKPGTINRDSEPRFSPDGSWIAFARVRDWGAGRAALFVIHPNGTGLRQLTGYRIDAGWPRWSPDGRTILFTQGYHASVTASSSAPLWTVPVIGGQPTALTHHPAGTWSFEGNWSPSGNQIVYKYYVDGWSHNQLRIMSADGSHDRALWTTPDGFTAESPDWAP